MSTNRHEASALKASWAWTPVVLGAVIALLGVILASGGVYLAMLGGSLYYAIVGVTLLAAGYLMMRRRIAGFYVYVGAFVFTVLWTIWEVGLTGWPLIPRLVGPFILLVLAVLVVPLLDAVGGRRVRTIGIAGAAAFLVAIAILVPIANRLPEPGELPEVQAAAPFEDPTYAPKKGEWNAHSLFEERVC